MTIRHRPVEENVRVGMVFGRLTTVEVVERDKWDIPIWLCRCDCGNTCKRLRNHLTRGYYPYCFTCAGKVRRYVLTLPKWGVRKFKELKAIGWDFIDSTKKKKERKRRKRCDTASQAQGKASPTQSTSPKVPA